MFENNGALVLLKYVDCKYDGMAIVVEKFP
jgi:hypothetical protein